MPLCNLIQLILVAIQEQDGNYITASANSTEKKDFYLLDSFWKKSRAKYAMNIAQLKCHFFVPAVDSDPC